jgi:hypothetical protein
VSNGILDRFAAARQVADAVLYEGYVLYPYRASSRKNKIRWQFGVLAPPAYSELDRSERSSVRTECIIDPGRGPTLALRIRFLHVQRRRIEVALDGAPSAGTGPSFSPVETLVVGRDTFVEWDEAVEREADVSRILLSDLREVATERVVHEEPFAFAGWSDEELIYDTDGAVAGRIVRTRRPVAGRILVEARRAQEGARFFKARVTVENTTEVSDPGTRREDVMGQSLVAVHTMLAVDGGSFVSLLEPPSEAAAAVAGCSNDGTFPVLISSDDLVLSSPIILYDYPKVAPESPGDLYDSTEIDEILALRVVTLTEEEKSEARGTDPRAAAIIDRCEEMDPQTWERLHGTMRSLHPETGFEQIVKDPTELAWWDPAADSSVDPWSDSIVVAGVEISKGAMVRLRPSHRADAQDLFLKGRLATVGGVFKDVDGNEHVAVTIDDDPATRELEWQGRYLFFFPDEIEPTGSWEDQRWEDQSREGQTQSSDGHW